MRLNKIYITNFGIYNGNYEYDFGVTKDKNVILVSGRNGSGKTTLLNVVKLSIYGPKMFGSPTTQNKQYLSYIQSNLNAFAKHENATNYEIGITFTMFHEATLKEFKITRRWEPSGTTLKETTCLYMNDELVSDEVFSQLLDYIHRNVPKTLLELFFFDGEKINDMFMLKDDLTDMLNHVYNLNLFLNLQKDLKQYRKEISVTKELSAHETAQNEAESKLDQLNAQLSILKERIAVKKEECDHLTNEYHATKEEFEALGGLNNAEQQKIKADIVACENEKAQQEVRYKELIEFLPFIMLTPQIKEILHTVKEENESKNLSLLTQCLESPSLLSYLNKELGETTVNSFVSKINTFTDAHSTSHLIYDFSAKEEVELENLWSLIKDLTHKDFENCVDEIARINATIRTLNKSLEASANEDLRAYMDQIADINTKLGTANQELHTYTEQFEQLTKEKKATEDELHKLAQELKNIRKEENLGNVINKVEQVLHAYCEKTKIYKQKEFEQRVSNMFSSLIRKDDFIQDVRVDEQTGEIMLFNALGGRLPKENLSAGEKQIYILSILFGIISMSRNKVPLVFDTLLGRLDHTHKTHIVNSFIKECGEQVIILATDTEIDDQYFELLKPMLSNYYKIDYDSVNRNVSHTRMSLS
ncbi:MAG: DNA sulfur modification protein DndD [Cellulosilyticum sp.]|nr:DNA sulfur modification protein DndD [Cellulosilyticum sp.]